MLQARTRLLLLTAAATVALNLLSEHLSADYAPAAFRAPGGGGAPPREGDEGPGDRAALADPVAVELFTGGYSLWLNGSHAVSGHARMAVSPADPSGIPSVRLSQIAVTLMGAAGAVRAPGADGRAREEELPHLSFLLSGVLLVNASQVAATGQAGDCQLSAVVELRRPEGGGGGPAAALAGVALASAECGLSARLEVSAVDQLRAARRVLRYALWANALTLVQIMCFLLQMHHTEESGDWARLSAGGLAAQALPDAYDSLLHLGLSTIAQDTFNAFVIVSLFKFTLFTMVEVRYLLAIWRHRNRDIFLEGWDAVRLELVRVYFWFYGVLVAGFALVFYHLDHLGSIVVLFQAYWCPQILHDVRHGCKNSLRPKFVAGISVTRCLSVLYLWGCPTSVFDGDVYPSLPHAPSLAVCAAAVAVQALQLAVMASQRALGPRWFVPRVCLPAVYNYHRAVDLGHAAECVICMEELGAEEGRQRMAVAVAPCGHVFHASCLERWMDVKMECPTCRAALPAMT